MGLGSSHLQDDEESYGYLPNDDWFPSFSPAKGLRNTVGENNCFLNVVIQALWHLVII